MEMSVRWNASRTAACTCSTGIVNVRRAAPLDVYSVPVLTRALPPACAAHPPTVASGRAAQPGSMIATASARATAKIGRRQFFALIMRPPGGAASAVLGDGPKLRIVDG